MTGAPPRVAVITVVRNAGPLLEGLLADVRAQSWQPLDLIVVDGASTDGTVALLEAQGEGVRWSSEPDRGVYDAMNKGVARVRGADDYVLFLGADDRFPAPDALARVLGAARGADIICGRLERDDPELQHRDVIGGPVTRRDIAYGRNYAHQAMLARRRVFDRVGGFDPQYRIAGDFDWIVRASRDPDITWEFVPEVVAVMRRGGLSERRYPAMAREKWRIVRRHYGAAHVARYALYTAFADHLKFRVIEALRRLGWLKAARGVRDQLRRPPGAVTP